MYPSGHSEQLKPLPNKISSDGTKSVQVVPPTQGIAAQLSVSSLQSSPNYIIHVCCNISNTLHIYIDIVKLSLSDTQSYINES